jgi:hypothetical protein
VEEVLELANNIINYELVKDNLNYYLETPDNNSYNNSRVREYNELLEKLTLQYFIFQVETEINDE